MAVSNAIGSNVFDILLCLGLPYFIKSLVFNEGSPVQVYSAGKLPCVTLGHRILEGATPFWLSVAKNHFLIDMHWYAPCFYVMAT